MIRIDAAHAMYQRPRQVRHNAPKKEKAPELPGLSTKEVSRLAGVSIRQLQWWDENGTITAPQIGHSRVYRPEQVRQIIVIQAFRKKGLALHRVKIFLPRIAKAEPGMYAVWDDSNFERIYFSRTAEEALQATLKARGPVVVVRIP